MPRGPPRPHVQEPVKLMKTPVLLLNRDQGPSVESDVCKACVGCAWGACTRFATTPAYLDVGGASRVDPHAARVRFVGRRGVSSTLRRRGLDVAGFPHSRGHDAIADVPDLEVRALGALKDDGVVTAVQVWMRGRCAKRAFNEGLTSKVG